MNKCTTVGLLLLAFLLSACNVNINLGGSSARTAAPPERLAQAPEQIIRPPAAVLSIQPAATRTDASPERLPAQPAGFTSYTNQEAGFAIALPPDWVAIPFDSQTLSAGMDKLRESQPELVQAIDPQVRSLIAAGVIKFLAGKPADGTAVGNLLISMNIARQPIPASVTLDQFMEPSVKALKGLPQSSGGITPTPVTLTAGVARRIEYRLQLNGAAGAPLTVVITQYVLVRNGAAYIISFQADEATAQQQATTFEQIAQRFAFRG